MIEAFTTPKGYNQIQQSINKGDKHNETTHLYNDPAGYPVRYRHHTCRRPDR